MISKQLPSLDVASGWYGLIMKLRDIPLAYCRYPMIGPPRKKIAFLTRQQKKLVIVLKDARSEFMMPPFRMS